MAEARLAGQPGSASRAVARSRFDRALVITVLAGLVLLLVVGVMFSAAHGSQQITSNATALHKTDEVLRAATVARAQLALAVHMAAVDREVGTDSTEAIAVSVDEASRALAQVEVGVAELRLDRADMAERVEEAAAGLARTGAEVLNLLDRGESRAAQATADDSLDSGFRALSAMLSGVRQQLAADIAESDALLGRIGNIARFLVAFLVPAAIILVYRELARRQQRQAELEHRLHAEHELARAREDFIANTSHELRTPLTGIYGLAVILEEEPAIKQSPAAADLLNMIISESSDLSRMVEDLLTAARLDAGQLVYTFEDVDVAAEVAEVVGPMRRINANIAVDCEPGLIRADRLRFRQVLRNLLSNAVKYGGSNIEVVGTAHRGHYECAVSDDGPGIPEELERRLYERFVYDGQRTASKDSVGLGLSIVRALVEGMGGSVQYSREYEETAFIFKLTLATGAPSPTALDLEPVQSVQVAPPHSERSEP